jgi:uncharacterized protein (DUF885 family)
VKNRISASLFVTMFLVVACRAGGVAETTTDEVSKDFVGWLDAQFEEELQFSPIKMTFMGRRDRYDELGDFSVAGYDEHLAWKRKSVEAMKAKFDRDALSPAEQQSWDVWVHQLEDTERGRKFIYDGLIFHQMDGAQSGLPTVLISVHTVESASDMDAYIKRVEAIPTAFDQLLEISKKGTAERGVRYPKFALEGVIEQSQNVITGQPFGEGDDSGLWADMKSEIEKLEKAKKVTAEEAEAMRQRAKKALVDNVAPAYGKVIAWAKEEMKRSPEIATGVSSRDNGAAYYAYRLWTNTTTDMNAEQIHELGLSEVARLREEMKGVMKQVDFEGDLEKFLDHVRKGEWNYYPNTDEGRAAYLTDAKAAVENIKKQLPQYFGLLPQADIVVKRVEPFRERDGAAQHYFPGTPDGSRPGVYYVHLSDMTAMPKNMLEVIAYHEGIPGHHMQIAIAQELKDVPKFRTQAHFTAYMEGWALYSEWLAKEIPGTYQDPYAELGRLTSEMWRAVRLVVDTGLHAKGWNEQQAIEYFLANTPEPEESVRSEVRRYIVWPGQATSYKIGMLRIQALRKKAEEALGDDFDIRGFHDAVLQGGAVPLEILDRQVEDWIQSKQAATASK